MRPESGNTESYWTATADVPSFSALAQDVSADICVVGAGIAGLTTAYLLARAGKSVVVIDDGPICGGETQRTTAHLSYVIDDRFYEIEREYGRERARLAYESHSAAIDLIEAAVSAERIDCDFVRLDGFLFAAEGGLKSLHEHQIEKEYKAVRDLGIPGVELLDTVPLEFFPEPRKAIRFPRQAQFHVLKYLRALANAILRDGGNIYSGTHASEFKDGKPARVKTSGGHTITAGAVVVATNSPVSDLVKVHTKQAAYRTYVVAGTVPKGVVARALYWDTERAYHYIRTADIDGDHAHEMLIIGGEDHRTGQDDKPEECFTALEEWAHKMFPMLKKIDYRWSGQVQETTDGLAFIGHDPAHGDNFFIATGDSGMGMTHGTIAGVLISDLVLGNSNPWTELYDPSRKPIKAGFEYARENIITAMQYADYLKPGDVKDLDDIARGEGAVMVHEGEHIAVYRAQDGTLSQCSAVCPHLKGIVCWNSVEKSWDCPAHGSRFKATGEVINGPANRNLDPVPEGKEIHEVPDKSELPYVAPGDSGIQPPPPPVM